jgi:hypothetical protein
LANCPHTDKILGLNEPISRRDFLEGMQVASTAIAVGAACPFPLGAQSAGGPAAGWTGYRGEGDYKGSAGNTEQVLQNAHAVRDGKFDEAPAEVVETGEIYDCVVVGGGQAGLCAGRARSTSQWSLWQDCFLSRGFERGHGSPQLFYGITPGSQSTPGPGTYLVKGKTSPCLLLF